MKTFFIFFILLSNSISFCEDNFPIISIITSVYKGERFIEQFLEDISKQSIYHKCEHIIIDANSPQNEWQYIEKHAEIYPNVKHLKLVKDPGLYAVWNIALLMSKAPYVITANVDDRMRHDTLEKLLCYIQSNPEVDLVYSDLYLTRQENKTFSSASDKHPFLRAEFSLQTLLNDCSPGNHPLWKKEMNIKYGLFDQSFKVCGDHEMWIRAAKAGAIFRRYPEFTGLFYLGETLSEGKAHKRDREYEQARIRRMYKNIQ